MLWIWISPRQICAPFWFQNALITLLFNLTPPVVDAPMELGMVFVNANDCGNRISRWASPHWGSNISSTLHHFGICALSLVQIIKIISLGFGTIIWFPKSTTHDSWPLNICDIIAFNAINPKKLVPQNNLGSTFEPYDWPFFRYLTFPNLDAIDFIWAAMLVTKAFSCANLASMVLGWCWASLVAHPLLTIPFPFWPLTKPWPLVALLFYNWPCHNFKSSVNDQQHAHMHDNGNMANWD